MNSKTAQIQRFKENALTQLKELFANNITDIKTMMSKQLARELYETMIWYVDTSTNTSPYPLCKPKIDRITVRGWFLISNASDGEVELKFIPSNIPIGKIFPPSIYMAFNKNIYLIGYPEDYIYLLWENITDYAKILAQLELLGATPIIIPTIAWYDPAWNYRKSHEILGSSAGAVTDYQIRIKVHYGSGVDSGEDVYLNGKCRNDFADLRFTDSDGVTELPYWIEEKVDGDYAIVWIKIPSIPYTYNVENGEWNIDGNTYHHRLKITIKEQSGNNLTDYQVKIEINTKWLVDNGYATSTGNEIRFTDTDGSTLLYFWRENDFNQSKTIYWVKIPSLPANSSKTIYIYFDEELTTVSDASNPTNTFIFFDDMEVWSGWVQYGSGQVSQDSTRKYDGEYSAHKTTANDPNGAYKDIGATIGRDIIIEFWINRNSAYSGGHLDRVGIIDNDGNGYGWAFNHADDYIGIDRRDSYSGSLLTSSYTTDYMDKWVFGRFIIKSDGQIIAQRYVDGILNGEVSTTDNNYSNFTRFYIFGGYDYWVDRVRIRKYVDPEPSVEIETQGIIIYIYYGNPNATSKSNGENVFIFFDDFIDLSKWVEDNYSGGDVSISDETAKFISGSDYWHSSIVKENFLTKQGLMIECRYKPKSNTYGCGGYDCGGGFKVCFITAGYKRNTAYYHQINSGYLSIRIDRASGGKVMIDGWDDDHNDQIRVESSDTVSLTEWHDVGLSIYNGEAKGYVDGVEKVNGTIPTSLWNDMDAGLGLAVELADYDEPQDAYIDKLRVRKYIDPEPSHGEWGSEETKP